MIRYIFKFPDIGEGIQEGKILEWYVKAGQKVESGESLVKMETDKVVTDIPSPKNGVVVNLFGKIGEVINVDDPLVEFEVEEEEDRKLPEKPVAEKGFGVVGTIEVAEGTAHLPTSNEGRAGRLDEEGEHQRKVLATPVARAMAKEMGVDINNITGTGPGGRVMKTDIKNYHEDIQVSDQRTKSDKKEIPDIEYQDLSQIRKTIAQKMTKSKQSAAHISIIHHTSS